jgi:hypothetical protein
LPDPSPLARVTSYVFAGDTLLILLMLAVITTPLRWMAARSFIGTGIVPWAIAAGLEASYYFHIVVDSGNGGKHLEMPDFSDLYDNLFAPLARYVLTLVPITISICWYGTELAHSWSAGLLALLIQPASIFRYPGPATLFVVTLALWPLMTAIAAIGNSVIEAYNPIIWFKTLRLFGKRYVAGATVFYALLVAESYILPQLGALLSIPIAGALALQMIALVAMALRGRVLGLVCEPYFRQ